MKKIYSLAFALVALLAITSCKNEIDDVFDQPSAERISAELQKTKEVLTSAKNGWCLEFFGKRDLGGYNILLKFDANNNVTAASELTEDVNETATSHYALTQSKGAILSFDTYNSIYHKFAAPIPDNDGMMGEVEYRIMRVTNDSIFLTGKKHETPVVMVRMDEKKSWANYLTEVHEVEKAMVNKWNMYTNGKDVQRGRGNNHTLTLVNTKDGAHSEVLMPYIIKPDGMHFYKTYNINGKDLTGFSYPATTGGKYTEMKDKTVTLEEFILPLSEQITESQWFIDPSQCKGLPKLCLSQMPNFMHELGEVIAAAWLGKDKDGAFGIGFKSSSYGGYMHLKSQVVSDTAIKFAFAGTYSGDGKFYFNSGYAFLAFAFAGTYDKKWQFVTKEWSISADNVERPTVLTLTDKANSANVIVLKATAVEKPFGN